MALVRRLPVAAALLALAACATVRSPTLEVRRLGSPHLGLTGGQIDVVFAVRNPNPEDLLIERFDYDLILDGRRIGRGYVPDPVRLRGFDHVDVRSRADLSLLRGAGALKRVLDRDRVDARVKGHFYVREGGHTRKLGFDSRARVDLR